MGKGTGTKLEQEQKYWKTRWSVERMRPMEIRWEMKNPPINKRIELSVYTKRKGNKGKERKGGQTEDMCVLLAILKSLPALS